MAHRSARAERAARIESLERLIVPRTRRGPTLEGLCAEHGLSASEMGRFARWLGEWLSREEQGEPPDEQQASEAEWANCRFTHGPGLCGEDCPGEFRHRPAWQPVDVEPVAPSFELEEREPETPPETDAEPFWPPRQPGERQVLLRDRPQPNLRF
jgi:hypothetical protein